MIVTVVTPTFNAAEFLQAAINSVRRNEGDGYEVDHVIVDAGSTDGTVEIAQKNGVRLMQGKDKGIFDAINKGSFNSNGDLLGFLGADDLMLDGALRQIVDTYKATDAGWVVGGIVWIDTKDRVLGHLAAPPRWMSVRQHVCLGWNPIMHMSTYFSRALYERLGGFDISFKDAGDYDLFARALAETPYARINRPLTCFRRTGANNSVVYAERAAGEARRVFERFGPKTHWETALWRNAFKLYFNARNPQWLMHKAGTRVRATIAPRTTVRYF